MKRTNILPIAIVLAWCQSTAMVPHAGNFYRALRNTGRTSFRIENMLYMANPSPSSDHSNRNWQHTRSIAQKHSPTDHKKRVATVTPPSSILPYTVLCTLGRGIWSFFGEQLNQEDGAETTRDTAFDALINVIAQGQYEAVLLLISDDPSLVQQFDGLGKTALHHAVAYALARDNIATFEQRCHIIATLLDHQAPVNHQDADGNTPLHLVFADGAWYLGRETIVELLLAYGQPINLALRNHNQDSIADLCKADQRMYLRIHKAL